MGYTYTWMNNSITLSETSSILNVSIMTESDVGVYQCEVKNSAGLSGSNSTTIELGGEYWRFFHLAILLQIGLYPYFEDMILTNQFS